MKKQSIVILGGGLMQLPLIREVIGRGCHCLVADANKDAPGMKLAHEPIAADIAAPSSVIIALKKSNAMPDSIITVGTDFSHSVATIAAHFNLPGISPEIAWRATNKIKMREVLQKSGVNQPDFVGVDGKIDVDEIKEKIKFPVVVKPADSMGARGVQKVKEVIDLNQAIQQAKRYSRSGQVVVENFILGQEFSLDALVYDNKVMVHGVADRVIEMPPYFVETGHVMPSQASEGVIHAVKKVFIEGVKAIGIDHGAAKGDIFWDGNKAYVGEIAARLSGGFMSGYTYPFATGINLVGGALDLSLGQFPQGLEKKWDKVSIERAIFAKQRGRIKGITGVDEARNVSGCHELWMNYEVGQEVFPPKNNVEKGGNVIASGGSLEEAEETMKEIFAHIKIDLAAH